MRSWPPCILPVQKTPTIGVPGRGILVCFSSGRSNGSLIYARRLRRWWRSDVRWLLPQRNRSLWEPWVHRRPLQWPKPLLHEVRLRHRLHGFNPVTQGLSASGRLYRHQGLGKQWHLMLDTTRHRCRHPCVPDSRCSSAGIYPIAVWHSNSTKGTHIVAMISLTVDKHALVKRASLCKIWSVRYPDG
jgi:hypothetical protein